MSKFRFDNIENNYKVVKRKIKVVIAGVVIAATAIASNVTSQDYSFQDIPEARYENVSTISVRIGAQLPKIEFNSRALVLLDDLKDYCKDDWDGEGAVSVNETTIENCRKILRRTTAYESFFNGIFATELGTVCLQWHNFDTDNLINVEVSSKKMAFYVDNPRSELYEFPPAEFNERSLETLLSKITRI